MNPQNGMIHKLDNFGIPTWKSQKCHSNLTFTHSCRIYYKEENGASSPSPHHGVSCECELSMNYVNYSWVQTTIQGMKGTKVKVNFQELHLTCGIHMLLFYAKFCNFYT